MVLLSIFKDIKVPRELLVPKEHKELKEPRERRVLKVL